MSNDTGVYGWGRSYGVYSLGNLHVQGTLSKTGGTFRIDHPLDPERRYLQHSFVESPDMMNVYNGNVVTDADGRAVVELPAYFEALNRDFRYQLTVIGRFAQAIVEEEVAGNRFVIRTNLAGVKVSWQVTGIRQDPWAEVNRFRVEVDKPDERAGDLPASGGVRPAGREERRMGAPPRGHEGCSGAKRDRSRKPPVDGCGSAGRRGGSDASFQYDIVLCVRAFR